MEKGEKEGPPGSEGVERLPGTSLLAIYCSYFSLDCRDQIYLAIKQKSTKGPKKDKLVPDL